MLELGFTCWRELNQDEDIDGFWSGFGIEIYESSWEGDFNFATHIQDGEFKSGYSIRDRQHIKDIVKAITGKDI